MAGLDLNSMEPLERRLEYDGDGENVSKGVQVDCVASRLDSCQIDNVSCEDRPDEDSDSNSCHLIGQHPDGSVDGELNDNSHGSDAVDSDKKLVDESCPKTSAELNAENRALTLREVNNKHFNSHNIEREDGKGSKERRKDARDVLPLSQSSQSLSRQKAGVILLGRGNSFSLGRSEVIVIHHRHKHPTDRRTNRNTHSSTRAKENKLGLNLDNGSSNSSSNKLYPLDRIEEKQDSDHDVKLKLTNDGVTCNNPQIPSPSPPPVSNGLSHADFQERLDMRDVESPDNNNGQISWCDDEAVKDLWQKAESIMALRKDKVRTILEEFGIGEPGGGGGEDECDWEDEDVKVRKKEEEDVWRIIQKNFQA